MGSKNASMETSDMPLAEEQPAPSEAKSLSNWLHIKQVAKL